MKAVDPVAYFYLHKAVTMLLEAMLIGGLVNSLTRHSSPELHDLRTCLPVLSAVVKATKASH